MNIDSNYQFILTLTFVVLFLLLIILLYKNLVKLIQKVNETVRDSIEPKFIEISPSTSYLIELAVDVWRLGKRLEKAELSVSDDQTKALQNSYSKLLRYLERNDIGITEYSGEKYNEGMNLDILAVEKDSTIKRSIIKETHEPAITHKKQLIRKAKVILSEP